MRSIYTALFLTILFGRSANAQTGQVSGSQPTIAQIQLCPPTWMDVKFGTCLGENNSIIPYDLGNDGTIEIIVNANTEQYLYRGNWFILKYDPVTQDYEKIYISPLHEFVIDKMTTANIDNVGSEELLYVEGDRFYVFDLEQMRQDTVLYIQGITDPFARTNIRFGDADNDGENEIVISTDDKMVLIDPSSYAIENEIVMEAGDFVIGNIDLDADLEVTFTHGLSIQMNGTGITDEYDFRPWQNLSDGLIELSNMDADPQLEVIVAEEWDTIAVYDVDIEFKKFVVNADTDLDALIMYDITGDSVDDIIYGEGQSADIRAYNGSNGVWLWTFDNPESGTTGIAIADFDGDSDMELMFGAGCSSSGEDFLFVHQLSNQAFEWKSLDMIGPFYTIEVGDVDQDGENEIVTMSFESNAGFDPGIITVYDALTKQIEFRSPEGFFGNANGGTFALELADYLDDGDMDIVIANSNLNRGNFWVVDGDSNHVEVQHDYPFSDGIDEFYALAIDDIDLDGMKEFIVADESEIHIIDSETFIVEWSSTGVSSGSNSAGVHVGNVDSDLEQEIIMCRYQLYSFDNGTYQMAVSAETDYTAIALMDWDGIAPLEIIAGTSEGQLKILEGLAFNEIHSIDLSPNSINGIKSFNLDGSGLDELIVSSNDRLYFIQTNGTILESAPIEPFLGKYDGLKVVDYDNDGQADIIAGALRGVVEIDPSCIQCLWLDAGITMVNDNPTTGADDGQISLSPSGGAQPYSISWSDGSTGSTIDGLGAGEYEVTITDANGCYIERTIPVYSTLVGLAENSMMEIGLAPNPALDNLIVSASLDIGLDAIRLYDLYGKEVTHLINPTLSSPNKIIVDTSHLASGQYLMVIKEEGFVGQSRFVKL
jgi:WD40 repeat protein